MKTKSRLSLITLAAVGATLALAVNAQVPGGNYPSSTAPGSNSSSSSAPSAEFSKLDTNKDGYISKSEAKKDKALSKVFDSLDTNHDGKLDPTEFAAYSGGTSSSGGASGDSSMDGPKR